MNQKQAYANYTQFPNYSYDCIKYLMDYNELIWKLLYYPDPDAWSKANLTREQKAGLVYNGSEDATQFRVFLDQGQADSWTIEACVIRIFPYSLIGKNRTVGLCTMMFEVLAHQKINHLTNYTVRIDTIIQQFLETFNGVDIGNGIGKLFFDSLIARDDKVGRAGLLPYIGKTLMMTNWIS